MPPWCAGCARPAPSSWASCSRPKAPLPTTIPRSLPPSTPGEPSCGPGPRPAARAWPRRRGCASDRWARTPGAPSAFHRPPTASRGSSVTLATISWGLPQCREAGVGLASLARRIAAVPSTHRHFKAHPPMPSQPAHHAFWPSRLPHSITVPATSVWDNLAVNARRYPDKAAIRYFGSSISYRELCEGTERMAAYLHSLGVQRGDRVILLMQNTPQLILAHYAIFRANAVVVPVNPMNMAEELRHYITDADAKVAITTADLAPELAKASNALAPGQRLEHLVVTQFTDAFDAGVQGDDAPPVQWHDWLLTRREPAVLDGGSVHTWQQALACNDAAPPHVVGRDDMAVLPYTSGTTGHPKGCMHPHRSINHNAVAGRYWGSGTHETPVPARLPLFHIHGLGS